MVYTVLCITLGTLGPSLHLYVIFLQFVITSSVSLGRKTRIITSDDTGVYRAGGRTCGVVCDWCTEANEYGGVVWCGV